MKKILYSLLISSLILAPAHRARAETEKAKKAEELMIIEKQIADEKEKSMIEHFYREGKRLLDEQEFGAAMEQFSRVLEIDPNHRGAKKGIKKAKSAAKAKREYESPEKMAKRLLKSGQAKYRRKDYNGALEDFQDALVLDYKNDDILEWIKRARHRQGIEDAEMQKKDITRQTEVAAKEKEAHEKQAMLEVEKSYLPPEKPERKPVEIEEIVSPEEEAAEKARQALLSTLRQKMVPAVSLTDADIRDVIRQLMEITGVTIVIDEGALAKAAGEEPLRLTFTTVTPMPLLEVLDIALKATELNYRLEPNYIWISSPDKLEKQNLVTRTYRLKYGVRRVRKVELKEFESKSSSGSE